MTLFPRIPLCALAVSLLTATSASVLAQEKAAAATPDQATRTTLVEDDKVQVSESHLQPGESSRPNTEVYRVIRALQGGTLLRTYADGRTEESVWKTGEVQIQLPAPPYTVKNVGNTEVVLYIVRLK